MSSKALLLPYTAITNPGNSRGLILTALAILIALSGVYAVLVNAIAGVQYKITSLNKEVVSQAAELAKNQTLILAGADQPNSESGVITETEHAAMQSVSSNLSYIYAESVFADASRPHP